MSSTGAGWEGSWINRMVLAGTATVNMARIRPVGDRSSACFALPGARSERSLETRSFSHVRASAPVTATLRQYERSTNAFPWASSSAPSCSSILTQGYRWPGPIRLGSRRTLHVCAIHRTAVDGGRGQLTETSRFAVARGFGDLVARGKLLHRPAVAVGIAEEHERAPREILDRADLDPSLEELLAGRVDVRDDQLQPLDGPGRHVPQPD